MIKHTVNYAELTELNKDIAFHKTALYGDINTTSFPFNAVDIITHHIGCAVLAQRHEMNDEPIVFDDFYKYYPNFSLSYFPAIKSVLNNTLKVIRVAVGEEHTYGFLYKLISSCLSTDVTLDDFKRFMVGVEDAQDANDTNKVKAIKKGLMALIQYMTDIGSVNFLNNIDDIRQWNLSNIPGLNDDKQLIVLFESLKKCLANFVTTKANTEENGQPLFQFIGKYALPEFEGLKTKHTRTICLLSEPNFSVAIPFEPTQGEYEPREVVSVVMTSCVASRKYNAIARDIAKNLSINMAKRFTMNNLNKEQKLYFNYETH